MLIGLQTLIGAETLAPFPPKTAHLLLVCIDRMRFHHTARDVVPASASVAFISALTRLQRFDVIRRGETARAEELCVIVMPADTGFRFLPFGSQRPGVDRHVARTLGKKGSDRY